MGGVSAFSSFGSFSTFNFQSNWNCLTDSREITVSSRAQPLRCESPPNVSQLPAINSGLHAIPSKRVFRNRLFIGVRMANGLDCCCSAVPQEEQTRTLPRVPPQRCIDVRPA